MFGRLKLPLGTEEAILVPQTAIARIGQLAMVMVVHEGHIRRRNVQLGRQYGDQIQILAGLQSGETILLSKALTEGRY
jgi:multidrug efflux pump subunit AcrA (membrane-fusion protein)